MAVYSESLARFSMSSRQPSLKELEDAPERDTHPVGAVVDLVVQLVEGFVEHEKAEEGVTLSRIGRQEHGVARDVEVAAQKCTRRPRLPEPPPRFEPRELGGLRRRSGKQARVRCVIERSQHPGHVLEWRLFLPPLGERA